MVKEEFPAGSPVACSETVGAEGNVLTTLGETLQFPLWGAAHAKVTVSLKPSCELTLIFPWIFPPDFTAGNAAPALNTKSGFNVTFKENVWVFAAGAPLLAA